MASEVPRLVIAGLSGDAGKTIVSMSLLAEIRRKALAVSAFKKGPDYIDSAWLGRLAGAPCRNLDTFMVPENRVRDRFIHHADQTEIAVIEGNRGLFDGKDTAGTHSTAELAKLIGAPVLLVVDCTKTTRTVAAMVKGCQILDPDLNIAGVVLNKIAGRRHQQVITGAIRDYCKLPVLGAIPKLGDEAELIPGRHLGLVPPSEFEAGSDLLKRLQRIASDYLKVDAILALAKNQARKVEASPLPGYKVLGKEVRIGCFRDEVFTFYYPENIEALEDMGAEVVPLSSLEDQLPDDLDGLYIGGGFPETRAERLIENKAMMESVKKASESGMPIYAECGGLIYLCRSLHWEGKKHIMTGVFPVDLEMQKRPAGHGYSEMKAAAKSDYYEVGEIIRGHEFHYSRPVEKSLIEGLAMHVISGFGLDGKMDGLNWKRTFASYLHIHADGNVNWAERLVRKAREYRKERQKKTENGSVTPLKGRATG